MTAFEKLKTMCPEKSENWYNTRVACECPDFYDIIVRDHRSCLENNCEECWNSEVVE